jgi:hypothetical protein
MEGPITFSPISDFRTPTGSPPRLFWRRRSTIILDARRLTGSDAAELLGMPQPKLSAIRNDKLRGLLLERLMRALTALGQRVEIVVGPSSAEAPPWIDVAA